MKHRLVVVLVLLVMVAGASIPAFAARNPNRLAVEARTLIAKAIGLSESDPVTSGNLFRKAFENAVTLTQPKMGQFWQETGLALASRCLHPDLFPEVRIAAETYREKFPAGRRVREVLVSLALLEAAEGNDRQALALLADAAGRAQGNERLKTEALGLDAALGAGYYRSAEQLLTELNRDRKVRRFKRDQKRFDNGTALLNAALKEVVEGRVAGEAAVRTLRSALEAGYFAEEAPAAELLALGE
ncbi:MAG TPA: hypothetical protein PKO06_18060, partial [Candidatus Ozemobacteraceae bacterium]|nr:hypothetical protein [Candidatus Ozemobacteraceae bacterium]